MLQNVANASEQLSEHMFETLLEVSDLVIPRSHELLKEYVAMDKELRVIERQLLSQDLSEAEEQRLISEKNRIKEPYERSQQNFENFFSSYYVIMSYFLEQERAEQGAQSNLMKTIEKSKEKVMRVVYEGI